jgi:hypothetical protein
MDTMERRNKNAGKTLIDYDLNIFSPEQYNEVDQEGYWDNNLWYIHVYEYRAQSGTVEVDEPFKLGLREIEDLCLGKEGTYFEDYDSWYGLGGFINDYKDCISDRIWKYLESFPKYVEDKQI